MNKEKLLLGARRKLMNYTPFVSLIGTDVGADQDYSDGWVFRILDEDLASPRAPENTGKAAVLISLWGSWNNPNRHNTLRFPVLRFTVIADQTRLDPHLSGAFTKTADSTARASRVLEPIFDCFHDAANRSHWWQQPTQNDPDGVYVVSCVADSEPRFYPMQGTDGVTQGELRFALEIG